MLLVQNNTGSLLEHSAQHSPLGTSIRIKIENASTTFVEVFLTVQALADFLHQVESACRQQEAALDQLLREKMRASTKQGLTIDQVHEMLIPEE